MPRYNHGSKSLILIRADSRCPFLIPCTILDPNSDFPFTIASSSLYFRYRTVNTRYQTDPVPRTSDTAPVRYCESVVPCGESTFFFAVLKREEEIWTHHLSRNRVRVSVAHRPDHSTLRRPCGLRHLGRSRDFADCSVGFSPLR